MVTPKQYINNLDLSIIAETDRSKKDLLKAEKHGAMAVFCYYADQRERQRNKFLETHPDYFKQYSEKRKKK